MIQVDSSDFRRWLLGTMPKLQAGANHALERTARFAAAHAKSSSRFKSHTYALRKSIRGELTGPFKARTIADARHAGWVENGNKPKAGGNKIFPRKAKFLRFYLNGQLHFRRWVNVAAPRPFMRDARHASISFFDQMARSAATDALK